MPNPRAQQPLSFDQIVKDAKSLGVPAQALLDALAGGVKGSVSATVGAPADIYNLVNDFSFRGQLPNLPYGSEDIAKMLPDVIPSQDKSRQHSAEYGETMGSFIPTPMAGQALKGAVKLGKVGARALGEEAGRRAVMGESFTPFVNTAIPQTHVVKPKGGNWFTGEVEKGLKGLKQRTPAGNDSTEMLRQMRERYTPEAMANMQEGSRANIIENFVQLEKDVALNNWVDKNLTNYVKNQMGTPDDPVRKLAEEGIVHKPFEDISQFDKDELGKYRAEQGFPPEGLGKSPEAQAWENESDFTFNIKKAKGLQELPEKIAKAELANAERIQAEANLNSKVAQYFKNNLPNLTEKDLNNLVKGLGYDEKERLIDDNTFSNTLAKLQKLTSFDDDYNLKRLQENPWVNKVAPDTNIYSAQTGGLGFDHILDVLKEDVASGRLRPESLKNVSMEQAVRRAHEYDQELAKKMEDARAKNLESMTVHKEYPEGYKWVQLDKPGQFSAESDAMGHSVRGYEPPIFHPDWVEGSGDSGSSGYGLGGWEAIKSGKAKVYSLVDSKGNPHTTVEVGKGSHPIGTSGRGSNFPHELTYGNYADPPVQIPEETRQQIYNLGKKLYFENPDAYAENRLLSGNKAPEPWDSFQKAADMLLGERPGYIKQIKGKSNRAPNDQYLPFVQDFVKSGNWSDVGDIHNTGLHDTAMTGAQDIGKAIGFNLPRFMAKEDYETVMSLIYKYNNLKQMHGEKAPMPEELKSYLPNQEPPVEGMKKGGAVSISDNPDTMYMELMDRKMQAGGAVSKLAKVLAKEQQALKASEALGKIEGRPLVVTQTDRTKVGGGYLGGSGFSGIQHTNPEYKSAEATWGVKTPGVAKMILGGGQKAGENPVFSTLIGSPTQHQSNQMVFDKLYKEFMLANKRGELDPDLRDLINERLAKAVDKDKNPIFPSDVDITNKEFKNLANTFDRRSVAGHLFGGVGVGGKKGQVIDYDKIIRSTTDPALLDVPSGSIGNRLFTLNGGIIDRPDLHPAFPTILQGEDFGLTFNPVPKELLMKDFIAKTRAEKGRDPGYMDYTRGYPPSQLITEELLTELQKQGHKKGGSIKKAKVGKISNNPDTMFMELADRKLAGGGAITKLTKLLAEAPELAHTVRGLYKAEAPELSGLIDKVQTPARQSVIPMPNRWFTKPKENPYVQPLVEKVLQVNNMKREDFHSGAFVDPKTGLILDNQIHNDVGVAIDPITNRPVMTSGGVTGMESLPKDQGSFTNSNLLKQGKYKPTGGDSILDELGFIATVDKAGMGHAYGLGTDYATPVLFNNLGTGNNPTLRPRSVGDVFGVGDVVGQMQINKNSPVHDVYEKLLVAPKGSDVEGVKLNKAKGGAVQSLETNLPALPKTDYHSIDKLMAHISKEHKIPPQKLHDDFVAKHHMTPDTWIKRK